MLAWRQQQTKAASQSAACCTFLVRVGSTLFGGSRAACRYLHAPNHIQFLHTHTHTHIDVYYRTLALLFWTPHLDLTQPTRPPSGAAVCGCGLDTVPVPGATQQQPAEERKALLDATAAVLLDVAAMAFRLGKPLSARLLPVPGGRAGQRTAFDSPFLLNCAVLPLV